MAIIPPSGPGMWVAFPKMLGGYKAAIPTLKACGFKWVAPRAGQGGSLDPTFTEQECKALVDAGLQVYPWVFSFPGQWKGEIEIYKKCMAWGASGFIIDAEIPWETGDHHKECSLFMEELDKAFPDTFIGDAPWPWIAYHKNFPAAEFAQRVNARLPQLYWTEITNKGSAFVIAETKKQWDAWNAAHPNLVKPIWPIGTSYGRDELTKFGVKQLPPGSFSVTDLKIFIDTYKDIPWSLYSLEATAPSGLEYLKALNSKPLPLPPQPPLPESSGLVDAAVETITTVENASQSLLDSTITAVKEEFETMAEFICRNQSVLGGYCKGV